MKFVDGCTHSGDTYGIMKLNSYLKDPDNLDEAAFAAACGVSVSCVRKWRYGDRFPRAHHLLKIEAVTGGLVTANDFAQAAEVA
jgi:DNA-binding transcriptional regulator YiaG